MNDTGVTNQSVRFDSTAQGGLGEDERHSIQAYVSDMLALERHIGKAVGAQDKFGDEVTGQGTAVVAQIKSLCGSHATALEQHLESIGGNAASPLKSAWSTLLGVGAELVNSTRKTKLTKALRDDYTALNLAAMGYTLLYTTAVGLGDGLTADLAKRHLTDYARQIMLINQAIPDVVLAELRADGENVRPDASELARTTTNEVWRSQSDVAH